MKGYIEYKMSRKQMNALLALRKGKAKKGSKQKYLCDYVQKHYGVLGTVVRVSC